MRPTLEQYLGAFKPGWSNSCYAFPDHLTLYHLGMDYVIQQTLGTQMDLICIERNLDHLDVSQLHRSPRQLQWQCYLQFF